MKNKLILPLLFLGLVLACGWGYSQYQQKRQWEINAENQYQRAFQELNGHVSNMETAMSKALVAASFPQTIRLLTTIWREGNSCQEQLGQLPLTSVDLSKTKTLLAQVCTYSFNAAQNKLLKGETATQSDWETLNKLRDQTRLISRHLLDLRQQFYTSRASWLEVDRMGTLGAAGLASKSLNNNKVTKAFLMLEDGLRRVPDMHFEGNNLDFTPKPSGLTGKNVSIKEAMAIAQKFLGPEYKNGQATYDQLIKGGFPSYMIIERDPKSPARERRLSISVKGGHVAWMLGNRGVASPKLNFSQAQTKAKDFLDRNGYPGMECVGQERFANIATFTFVPLRKNVRYYPELIKTQVAQDNGEILGFDAIAYLTFNEPDKRESIRPQQTENKIRKLLSPNLKVEKIQLAQVLDEMYNKVPCYEVRGTQGKDHYLLYYNANTGNEEKIRRVDRNGTEIQ